MSKIDSVSSHVGSVRHVVGKLSMKATTLLQTSLQSKVYMLNYVPPKSWESQLWEFWDSHSGVPRQKIIWMWVPWRVAKYTIKGKVVVSPKSGPWWVLWVWSCMWLVLTPKVLWRAPKSRGETHLRVPQNQVAESWNLEARSRFPTLERGRGSSWEPSD
jgi:hypothetical protein